MLYGIDIFSGAGGLSLGAEMAGIVITHAIEIDPHAAASFKNNHKEATVHCGDIKSIDSGELIDKNKRVFVIMGGPPCQGFSMSNTMSRNMENPKNFSLYSAPVPLALRTVPPPAPASLAASIIISL